VSVRQPTPDILGAVLGGAPKPIDLELVCIRRDGGTQPREGIVAETVAAYVEALHLGAEFPAVDVMYDGTNYWLYDGYHRTMAHIDAGRTHISANVHQGTKEDAQWQSYAANQAHGLQRSNGDKERAVRAALRHAKAVTMSDNAVAKHLGVSDKTVSKYRRELEASSEIPKIDERTVTRNGQTYTQNTANIGAKPAYDNTPVYQTVAELEDIVRNFVPVFYSEPGELLRAPRDMRTGVNMRSGGFWNMICKQTASFKDSDMAGAIMNVAAEMETAQSKSVPTPAPEPAKPVGYQRQTWYPIGWDADDQAEYDRILPFCDEHGIPDAATIKRELVARRFASEAGREGDGAKKEALWTLYRQLRDGKPIPLIVPEDWKMQAMIERLAREEDLNLWPMDEEWLIGRLATLAFRNGWQVTDGFVKDQLEVSRRAIDEENKRNAKLEHARAVAAEAEREFLAQEAASQAAQAPAQDVEVDIEAIDVALPANSTSEPLDLVPVSKRDGYDSNEWYTPAEYIEAARSVMGGIDLDPASCELAQTVVKADVYLTKVEDGLSVRWCHERVWLNPPYGETEPWVAKLIGEFDDGTFVKQAVIVVNNGTETAWFQSLLTRFPVCFLSTRIPFWRHDQSGEKARQGQAIFYLGTDEDRFIEVFRNLGPIMRRVA
jgi:hypothetical protein